MCFECIYCMHELLPPVNKNCKTVNNPFGKNFPSLFGTNYVHKAKQPNADANDWDRAHLN